MSLVAAPVMDGDDGPAVVFASAVHVLDDEPSRGADESSGDGFASGVLHHNPTLGQSSLTPPMTPPHAPSSTAVPNPASPAEATLPTAVVEEPDEGELSFQRCARLASFLNDNSMSKHLETLTENEVDFDCLLMFEEADLKELGIAKGPRVKMLRTMEEWHRKNSQRQQTS